uniref:Thioredoxin domain-containing protein n=1 Tax=Ditylenchus dipsaci TaxID=166011 RepID=A0A915E2G5_9BILA
MPTGNLSPIAESRPSLSFSLVPPPTEATLQQNEQRQKIRDPLVTTPNRTFEEAPEISEDDIRKSLIVEAKRRKYWGTKAITKMLFEEIEHSTCYHYMLESFTETRSTAEATEACASTSSSLHHHGSHSHGSSHNTSSTPTTTTLNDNTFHQTSQLPDQEFADQTKVLEMPSSNECPSAIGFGTDKCQYCRGTGMKAGVAHPAVYTHPMNDPSRGYPGSGSLIVRPPGGGNLKDKPYAVGTPVHFMVKAGLPPPGIGQHDLCIFCQGRGISDCHHCKGQGKKSCPTCGGQGNVRVFTKLKVFFSFCGEPKLCTTTQKTPYKRNQRDQSEILCCPPQKSHGSCRLLKQRHCVEAISIAKIKFKLGNKNGYFYVYVTQFCFLLLNFTSTFVNGLNAFFAQLPAFSDFLPGYLLNSSNGLNSEANLLPAQNSTSCPNFDVAYYYVRRQCPASVAQDLRCVINLPGDVQPSGLLNCGTVEDFRLSQLHNLNPEELLELIRFRDSYGRPWCMISFLYSPDCVFSAKVADAFYQIAPLFPKLKVIAVDVSANTKSSDSLISQYGIASTPVIALWENGFPRFRLYEDYSKVESLIKAIQMRTDLKSLNISKVEYGPAAESEEEDLSKEFVTTNSNLTKISPTDHYHPTKQEFLDQFHYLKDDLGFDWYLLAAVIVLCLNTAYFLSQSTKAKEFIQRPKLCNASKRSSGYARALFFFKNSNQPSDTGSLVAEMCRCNVRFSDVIVDAEFDELYKLLGGKGVISVMAQLSVENDFLLDSILRNIEGFKRIILMVTNSEHKQRLDLNVDQARGSARE